MVEHVRDLYGAKVSVGALVAMVVRARAQREEVVALPVQVFQQAPVAGVDDRLTDQQHSHPSLQLHDRDSQLAVHLARLQSRSTSASSRMLVATDSA